MGGEQLRGPAGAGGGHLAPEGGGAVRVVACERHQREAHVVGLALVLARKGQQRADLRAEAVDARRRGLHRGAALLRRVADRLRAGRRQQLLAHPLVGVLGDGVRDLVAEDDRELVVRRHERHQPRVDDDLAAGHAEGVDLLVLDEVELPGEVRDLLREAVLAQVALGGGRDAATDALHLRGLDLVSGDLGLAHVAFVLRKARREDLGIGDERELPAARDRDRGAPGGHRREREKECDAFHGADFTIPPPPRQTGGRRRAQPNSLETVAGCGASPRTPPRFQKRVYFFCWVGPKLEAVTEVTSEGFGR